MLLFYVNVINYDFRFYSLIHWLYEFVPFISKTSLNRGLDRFKFTFNLSVTPKIVYKKHLLSRTTHASILIEIFKKLLKWNKQCWKFIQLLLFFCSCIFQLAMCGICWFQGRWLVYNKETKASNMTLCDEPWNMLYW